MSELAQQLKFQAASGAAFASAAEEVIWRSEAIALMMRAAREIERRDKSVGAVTTGLTFAEVKDSAKVGNATSKTAGEA